VAGVIGRQMFAEEDVAEVAAAVGAFDLDAEAVGVG
jgi:hypothetical protein